MYQALYRVWRPKTFSDMVGQEAIVRTLRNQVTSGRVAHAYLFCGSRGTGKTSAARILTRAINCENHQGGDPCGKCNCCRTIESGASFDVYEMDAASNSRVEEIRELLEKVDYPPQFSKYKVYIIDEVHMLSNAAFNALLKTLEEPPEYMVFILATTEPQKLPATILSRCQRYDFGRYSEAQIAGHLEKVVHAQGAQADQEALSLIAQAAEGGMRDALSILDMCLGEGKVTEEGVRAALGAADKGFLFAFTQALADRQEGEALKMVDDLMRSGKDVQVFLKDFSAHLRLLMAVRLCGAEGNWLGLSQDNARRYAEQAELFSQERLLRLLEMCMRGEADTRWAASARSVLEIFALRACDQPESRDVDALLERIGELEMRIRDLEKNGVRAAAPQPSAVPASVPRSPIRMEAPVVETPVAQGNKLPKDVWNDMLKFLKRNEPGLFGPLSQGKYGGYQEGTYKALFGEEADIFRVMLSAPERKQKIENALNQCGAVNARFEACPREILVDPEQQKQDEKNVSGLIDMFGRDKVQIDD
ncbi:MAG: DNA polymerase III subunit gamma/tau [Clostridiales bacterium]|nr:DNA polymerase III subunit gamma/tau [Clostridiales bacterium]